LSSQKTFCGSIKSEMTGVDILGIDAGSVAVSAALLAPDGRVGKTAYGFHHGDVARAVAQLLADFDLPSISEISATSETPHAVVCDHRVDGQIALIRAVRRMHPEAGGILSVGGEKFSLICFGHNGEYAGSRINTACAAGTGSFLDQQAARLNLSGIAELSAVAEQNSGRIPKIATRCAVFAKTDLIHAQQKGYALAEISEGLCRGLAKNICDTLFSDDPPRSPIVFCGGVARNRAVVRHIRELSGIELIVEDFSPVYGAIGAGLHLMDAGHGREPGRFWRAADVVREEDVVKHFEHKPLKLALSEYPSFEALCAYVFEPLRESPKNGVEVDIYEELSGNGSTPVYLGFDIGSTSTKALWLSPENRVLAGFYTRTAGRPVDSMQSLLAAMEDLAGKRKLHLRVLAAATTGSGRRFVGRILGADLVIDEITAHARAACELDPRVDTIIEIGGQDSKFTTLQSGRVTRSIMNTVCAAGTGSFIEEQAQKLRCPLSEYAERAEAVRSPSANDRCTVFMERDINAYINRGYTVDEVLAAALHSVRENYLTKVAEPERIGEVIFFQGATAKNRALVAAFEQKLKKPILVSRFCHLTGAMGVALALSDSGKTGTGFRGLDLCRARIPVRTEVCSYCTNHCKITVAEMADGPVAFGFLCGRDYWTDHFVDNNKAGFDLIRERRRIFSGSGRREGEGGKSVGIPAALYLWEDVQCWQRFFDIFGIRTVTSAAWRDAVNEGKKLSGAEFCAPMAGLHGHVRYLLDRADYVFLPYYLENQERRSPARRQYCYYSQFAPSLVSGLSPEPGRVLMPVVNSLYGNLYRVKQLCAMLKGITGRRINPLEVAQAHERAFAPKEEALSRLRWVFESEMDQASDVCVVLLGRPYTVLSPSMNKAIPDIFSAFGVKTFFQDMLPEMPETAAGLSSLLSRVHWHYAARIIEAAAKVIQMPGLYPVFVTSFKCAPDAFVKNVLQDMTAAEEKPYLVLELDEHDSSIGYETRIEAAVRAFRNHREMEKVNPRRKPLLPQPLGGGESPGLSGKTLILPNWDPLTCPLLVESLKREGIDCRLMEQSRESAEQSMSLNGGQCIPCNVVAKGYIDTVSRQGLDPARTLLWMGKSEIACHLGVYPHELKQMIARYGKQWKRTSVYAGPLTFSDISLRASLNTYFAFMFGGMLRRLACRVRPYEEVPGETDEAVGESVPILSRAFAGARSRQGAVKSVVERFERIRVRPESRPKVAVFGDLFVRDNPVMNQDLLHFIESCGGEAVTTPYTEYIKMIAPSYLRKWFTEGCYLECLRSKSLLLWLARREKAYSRLFNRILKEREASYQAPPERILAPYRMIADQTGESMDNIVKIHYLARRHPRPSLFVQTSPALCCPSLVTEAMAAQVETQTGIPVVCLTYDGTQEKKNRAIIPYLAFPRRSKEGKRRAC
jgi:predicted CoA-substrate-specific enzyme activase